MTNSSLGEPVTIYGTVIIDKGCFFFKSKTSPLPIIRVTLIHFLFYFPPHPKKNQICVPLHLIIHSKINSMGVLVVQGGEFVYNFNYIEDPNLLNEIKNSKMKGKHKVREIFTENIETYISAFEEAVHTFSNKNESKKKGELFDIEKGAFYVTQGKVAVLLARDKTKIAVIQEGEMYGDSFTSKDEHMIVAIAETTLKMIPSSLFIESEQVVDKKRERLKQFIFYNLAISDCGRLRRLTQNISHIQVNIEQANKQLAASDLHSREDRTFSSLSYLENNEVIIQNGFHSFHFLISFFSLFSNFSLSISVPCIWRKKGSFTFTKVAGRIILTTKRFWFIASSSVWGDTVDIEINYVKITNIVHNEKESTFTISTLVNSYKFFVKGSLVLSNLLSVIRFQKEERKKALRTTKNSIHLSSAFSPSEIRALFPRAKTEIFRRGETLIQQGTRPKTLYYILDGKVSEKTESSEKTIAVLGQSDFVGIVYTLEQGVSSTSLVAEEDTSVLDIPFKSFEKSVNLEFFFLNFV